jgi:hypothetical protein
VFKSAYSLLSDLVFNRECLSNVQSSSLPSSLCLGFNRESLVFESKRSKFKSAV